jgi:hypothetical protein
MAWDTIKIWKDKEERWWALADSGIDAEIFETIGDPVYDKTSGVWYQQIALRSASD